MARYRLICLFTLFSLATYGQNCPEGISQYQEKNYTAASIEFSKCLKEHPTDSSVVFMNGYTLLILKEYNKAIPLLKRSIALNYEPVRNTQYAIARSYAGLNNREETLKYLDLSIQAGFASFPRLDSSEFDQLRMDAKFLSLKEKMEQNAFPCLKEPNNAKFDFWVGDWDVFVSGSKRADSKITKAKGGCAILEDYTVLAGTYAGQSISYYDDAEKIWHQYWVGSGGDKSKYYEPKTYEGQADMQFVTKFKNADGTPVWTRMSYIQQDANTVLQNLDNSNDEGKSWTPGFRGVYKRKTK
jgi:tetratricopeptide (TPR) repeat protein